jgi:hypothetical protein
MKSLHASFGALLLLSACSKPETALAPVPGRVVEAAATPLNDLNLVHTKIPPALLAALKAPYAPPPGPGCEELTAEIKALDAALGPDLDAPPTPGKRNLVERGVTEVGNAAVGTVKSAAESLIPYRSWVRKLTGAEKASKQVTAAVAAGMVRRAYLKGIGQARGCGVPPPPPPQEAPAEPVPAAEPATVKPQS